MTDAPPAAGPVTNVVTAAALVAVAVAVFLGSLALGVGSPARPGPGTWPLLVSAVLGVLGLALAGLARRTTDAERFTRPGLLVLAAVGGMVVFVALLPVIGFEVPALLVAFAWMRFLGGESWLTAGVVSLATVAVFYLLFVGLLSVPIPHLF
ncbi:tripartite tricarboxylate transporter TctB family protein [Paractinoplanes rishiriensis]|uniref:DUF1468 domain-containing protein n=1 Tax=Paractinoplanes rishiriensis TaxID=1050105 RepID=A0A919JSP1_9ACTN|nr:tripartite tricarboxylate transporter TctB family protein [Actinoplanes rishiriensis]GIE94110.1 hypothetical protein Ari01nite_15750 [Actinoplanes rishiriensis]